MITVVQRATLGDYLAFYRNVIPGWVIYHGGERVGMAGISHSNVDGRWWAYLNLKSDLDGEGGLRLVREMRAGLEMISEDVYVLCEEHIYATAPRLLRILGFKPTDEVNGDMVVWVRPGSIEGD